MLLADTLLCLTSLSCITGHVSTCCSIVSSDVVFRRHTLSSDEVLSMLMGKMDKLDKLDGIETKISNYTATQKKKNFLT